ncbi:MAG: hypothetical protein LBP70_01375 [Mycoplasmataceae bacterium]|jgi:hypothetical protein|nr:hypothetical protein [Mycoplasmataceae bacterium]
MNSKGRPRNKIEGKTFGRYHVLKYHYENQYDYNKIGSFYDCFDMVDGKIKIIRRDHLIPIQKNYEQTLKEIEAINEYKKKHNLG